MYSQDIDEVETHFNQRARRPIIFYAPSNYVGLLPKYFIPKDFFIVPSVWEGRQM